MWSDSVVTSQKHQNEYSLWFNGYIDLPVRHNSPERGDFARLLLVVSGVEVRGGWLVIMIRMN